MTIMSNIAPLAQRSKNRHVRNLIAAATICESLILPAYKWIQSERSKRSAYIIRISETDEIYYPLLAYIYGQIPLQDLHCMELMSRNDRIEFIIDHEDEKPHIVDLDGHRVAVSMSSKSIGNLKGRGNDLAFIASPDNKRNTDHPAVCLTVDSYREIDALKGFLDGFYKGVLNECKHSSVLVPGSYNDWNRRDISVHRDLRSIALRDGQLEYISDDLEGFLLQSTEQRYADLGIPYHRGYVFHGPPGTGKTSLAKALATRYNLDVYYLPLASIESDINIMTLLSQINPRSILLLEDADVYSSLQRVRSEESDPDPIMRMSQPKVTLSGMLNALDGIYTPHGLITIITTNDLDALDSAILRPGRIDVIEKFDNLDIHQINHLCDYMSVTEDLSAYVGRSPAELVERIKSSMVFDAKIANRS